MPSGRKSVKSGNLDPRTIPASPSPPTIFSADDADLIIRAGNRDFRVHKSILSLVSPFFKDTFSLPQAPLDDPKSLPHLDVGESAETWESVLRAVYHMPIPPIDDLGDLESLLLAAKKYRMRFIIDSHKHVFEDRGFILQDPLHLYAIACSCGFEDQAKHVARSAELLTVTKHTSDLKGFTVGSYHNLVSFLTNRDNEWHKILRDLDPKITCYCSCGRNLVIALYSKIAENLKRPYLRAEEIYLKALEARSLSRQPGCLRYDECAFAAAEIRRFVEQMVRERDELCDELMRDKRYVQRHSTTLLPIDVPLPRFIKS